MKKRIFITGIDTDIGKTIISAILVEKLQADYWKPIQSGELDNSDSMKVKAMVSNSKTIFHEEGIRLKHPASPHLSAKMEGKKLQISAFHTPETTNNLIIEGAGGLMVPINETPDLLIDLIPKLAESVVLVSKNYLGSINHTMLSIEALINRNIKIEGIIFNGETNEESEKIILKKYNLKCLGRIPLLSDLSPLKIKEAGDLIDLNFD